MECMQKYFLTEIGSTEPGAMESRVCSVRDPVRKQLLGIGEDVQHAQYERAISGPPLQEIFIMGRPGDRSNRDKRRMEIRKQLMHMLAESDIILQKTNFLKEQSRALLDDAVLGNEIVP